ncbi:MAG: cytochrome c [Synechococcaceae bacterium WB8_1B_136]|nr:cytochrome c [Synechococcaceae bacterium WB8_1B_136]
MGAGIPTGVAQFSHGPGGLRDQATPTVTGQLTEPTPNPRRRGLISALVLLAASCVVVALAVVLPAARSDPYSRNTLQLAGSPQRGEQLFLINCAGCHGIAAQGLVGPNLHGVGSRKNSRQLIQQVVSGRTPPMPRFQPEPQAMADLLAYLRTLA